jgi:hypothetical protein
MKVLHSFLQRSRARPGRDRGQSMVEMALTLPVLLLIMAGTLEVGWYYNTYLTLVDATREAARYAADGDLVLRDYTNTDGCDKDFFYQAACLLKQNLFGVTFNEDEDDIIVSTFTISTTGSVAWRFPYPTGTYHPLCSKYVPPGYYCPDSIVANDEDGWSYQAHRQPGGGAARTSFFTKAEIESRLPTGAIDNGIVIVEIFHVHRQLLGLIPPGLPFLPQQVVMHAYTVMPMPAAAPALSP